MGDNWIFETIKINIDTIIIRLLPFLYLQSLKQSFLLMRSYIQSRNLRVYRVLLYIKHKYLGIYRVLGSINTSIWGYTGY